MKTSVYESTVPASIRALSNLAAILAKADAHATARKIEPGVLLQSRLYPDMLALVRQVQIATDIAKSGAARLAGTEAPAFADDEASFADLQARVAQTVSFLKTLTPAQFEGAEDRVVRWKTRSTDNELPGLVYLNTHVLPNVYFHVTTAYNILRHNGVELGKRDYLG